MFRSYSTPKKYTSVSEPDYDITFMTIKHISDTILKLNFVQHPKVLIITMLKINFSNSIKFKDLLLPKMNISPLITLLVPNPWKLRSSLENIHWTQIAYAVLWRYGDELLNEVVLFAYKRYSCCFITFIFHW